MASQNLEADKRSEEPTRETAVLDRSWFLTDSLARLLNCMESSPNT